MRLTRMLARVWLLKLLAKKSAHDRCNLRSNDVLYVYIGIIYHPALQFAQLDMTVQSDPSQRFRAFKMR
jgi:hypothetical protein